MLKVPKGIPKEDRAEYRRFFFHSDIAQSRVVLALLTIAIAAFGLSDYLLLGLSFQFYLVEIFRILLVVYSIIVILKLKKRKTFRSYDSTLFLYLLAFVAFSLFVNTSRPEGFTVQVVILGMSVFAFYLALPTRFLNQFILSSFYTVGEAILLFYIMPRVDMPQFIPILSTLVFANLIAALASWQFNYYRWLVFKDLSRLRKSERFVVIGQTVGMVGHDIRNPLQAITNDLFLVEDELKRNPSCKSEDIAESIDSINENIGYINKIVSDLQDYTGKLTLNITSVHIRSVFLSLLDHIPKTIKTEIIAEDFTLKTDGTYLKRILSNLVMNAVQAMPNGGQLMLEAKAVGNKAMISVMDTGVGIPTEAKPNLFTPLFTTKAKGQGLGLAVVKRLVMVLHGTITFESEVGKGTKFIIELPIE
jgi:signal transduction histidine kinase